MKTKRKRISPRAWLAALLALTTAAGIGVVALAGNPASEGAPQYKSTYDKVDISDITGEIAEPPELTSAASSVAREKEWYEYVYYSSVPVGYYYLSDTNRVAFYDPYDYADALVMEVDDNITDWSSMNTLQVSYSTGNSLAATFGLSSTSSTSVLVGYTDTTTTTEGGTLSTSTTITQTDSYNTAKTRNIVHDDTTTQTVKAGSQTTASAGTSATEEANLELLKVSATESAELSETVVIESTDSWKVGEYWTDTEITGDKTGPDGGQRTGYTKSHNEVTVETGPKTTTVSNVIADRVTKATGHTFNGSISLSENNSITITKTYDASHFNANGSPLQWKVIKYTVRMPMKYQVQYLIDDEWVFYDYSYCLLTTIQGTTRTWLQNNVAYYEHWGTGETVTWDEFWNQFFTPEKLIQAYQNRLYPDN